MFTAAAAVPYTAPPFQGARSVRSSVRAITCSGSAPISSSRQAWSCASTGSISHSAVPSPQPLMPASVSSFSSSHPFSELAIASPVPGSRTCCPVATLNLYVRTAVIFIVLPPLRDRYGSRCAASSARAV